MRIMLNLHLTGFTNPCARSPPASTKNARRIPNFTNKNAREYMRELELDDDVEEDIQQEMEIAKVAWSGIVSAANGNMTVEGALILEERMSTVTDGSVNATVNATVNDDDDDDNDIDDDVLCQLVTALGTTYSEEEHGVTLRRLACVVNGSDISNKCSMGNVRDRRELTKEAFIGWYIRLLFDDNNEDEEDDVNWRNEDEDADDKDIYDGMNGHSNDDNLDVDGDGDRDDDDDENHDSNIIVGKNYNSSTSSQSGIIIGAGAMMDMHVVACAGTNVSTSIGASTSTSTVKSTSTSVHASGGFGGNFGNRTGLNTLGGDSDSWKCVSCMIMNIRDAVRCVCCDSKAPQNGCQSSLESSGKVTGEDMRVVRSSSILHRDAMSSSSGSGALSSTSGSGESLSGINNTENYIDSYFFVS